MDLHNTFELLDIYRYISFHGEYKYLTKTSNVHFVRTVSRSPSSWDKLPICDLPTFLLYTRRSHFSTKTFPTLQSSSPILLYY